MTGHRLVETDAALASGERAVRGVLDRLDVVMVDGIEPGWVRNVNRPQDLSS